MPNNPSHSFPPIPNEFSPEEKDWLEVLWRTHHRALIDVKPTREHLIKVDVRAMGKWVPRLHSFIHTLIRRARYFRKSSSFPSQGADHLLNFVKPPGDTCLREFLRFTLQQKKSPQNNDDTDPPSIRLYPAGRAVFQIPHQEFTAELNRFEARGRDLRQDELRRESFGAVLYFCPDLALASLGCALALATLSSSLHDIRQSHNASQMMAQFGPLAQRYVESSKFVVRFLHVDPTIQMMDIKTGLVGKLVSVKGHVVKARAKRLRLSSADFICQKCRTSITFAFESGRYGSPSSCPADGCNGRSFTFQSSSARYTNLQELRLQEAQDESTAHAGRAPRQLMIEVENDLVETCRPGDMVQVAATIAAVNTALAAGKRGKKAKETSTYQLYMIAHSIGTLSETNNLQKKNGKRQKVYTQEQLQNITQLCHADHQYFGFMERRAFPFDLLVRSLCPSIIGHNTVKAGLLLCLLGGTPNADRGNQIRCNSHCLIVGDPGMGKSQMLLAASQLAARSVYVGGNTSTTTGLTVTLGKEEKSGESAIEAGALVLADQGICCIDEFDKMAKAHQDGLLEAMEQQQVSIAKAGVVASLPARCSLIAAANPRQGTYNMDKTVSENLNMAKPILSRFDLVFILRDRADSNLDHMVSSNIMNLYRKQSSGNTTTAIHPNGVYSQPPGLEGSKHRLPLSARLSWVTEMQKQPLPAELVRDYIAYAREYCKPKMTDEAAKVLKDYFMELRYPSDGSRKSDTVPITTRQLEAMIRLCQARAKACLRDFCLEEDALDIIELMNCSVEQVHSNEAGNADRSRGGAGGSSMRKVKKAFIQELHKVLGASGEISLNDLRRIAMNVKCGLSQFQDLLEDLRTDTILMKTGENKYKLA